MGVKCQIEKKGNKIERVEAPNGEPSVLYESALKVLGDSERALQVWAKAYTPDFYRITVIGITLPLGICLIQTPMANLFWMTYCRI